MKINLIQRRAKSFHYSIENYFPRVCEELNNLDISAALKIVPFYSSGILPRLQIIKYAKKNQGDITHITGDIHFAALGLDKGRSIVTVLDCGRLHQLSGIRKQILKKLFYSIPLRRAKAITTISEYTKQDLLHWVPDLYPEKIHVIPVSVSPIYKYYPRNLDYRKPQILQIGSTPNKNISRLARSLKGIECNLIIVGNVSPEDQQSLVDNSIDYQSMTNLTDEDIYYQYKKADIVSFPSTIEGFGMPIIEGQKVGRPVVTSNTSSMPEVAGDGAVLVDPYSISSIRSGFERIIADSSFRNKLIEKGRINAERFQIEQIAEKYLALYRKLYRNPDGQ